MQGRPLWGSRWWISIFRGSKVLQKPHFGGLNKHFKPNMRKIQIAISSGILCVMCTRLTWNLTGSCGRQQILRGWSRRVVKQFQDGGRPPFWKTIYRHISQWKIIRFWWNFVHSGKFWTGWTSGDQMKKLHWTESEFDRTYFLFSYILFIEFN